jgi:hypothetical protein
VNAGPSSVLNLRASADSPGTFTFVAALAPGTATDADPGNDADSVTVVVTPP